MRLDIAGDEESVHGAFPAIGLPEPESRYPCNQQSGRSDHGGPAGARRGYRSGHCTGIQRGQIDILIHNEELILLTYQSVNNILRNVSIEDLRVRRRSVPIRRRRKEERPAEIIEAALREFARRGFAATRLEDVAERAGVTKGTIYVYFKNKEDLFKAAARAALQPTLNEIEALSANFVGTAEELLRTYLREAYPKVVKNSRAGQILRLLIAEGAQFPELVDFYYQEIVSRGLGILRRVVEDGVARGEFRRTRMAEFPQVLFGPVMAATIWGMVLARRHPIDLEAYAKTHIDLVLNGLKAR